MAYIPKNQPTKDMYLELVNVVATQELTDDDVSISAASDQAPDAFGRNTQVTLTAKPNRGLQGAMTTSHRRFDADAVFGQSAMKLFVPISVSTTHDCLDAFNQRFGTALTEDDVQNDLVNGTQLFFNFTDDCYLFFGSCVFVADYTANTDTRPLLSSVVLNTILPPLEDHLATDSFSTLVAAVADANPNIGFLQDITTANVFFLPAETVTGGAHNSSVVMVAGINNAYRGSVTLSYDRIEDSTVVLGSPLNVPEGDYPNVSDLFDAIDTLTGYRLSVHYDVVDEPWVSGEAFQTADGGLVFMPGLDVVVVGVASCTSCLGAWTGDIATYVNGLPLTTSDSCGHELSITDPASGIIYGYGSASSIPITWPACECRIFQADLIEWLTMSSSSITTEQPITIGLQFGNVFWFVSLVEKLDGTHRINITLFDFPAYQTIDSVPDFHTPTRVDKIAVGVCGDGKLIAILDGNYYTITTKESSPVKLGAFTDANILSGTPSGTASTNVITDAANMTITVPDMSADGITAVKDFCGNLI